MIALCFHAFRKGFRPFIINACLVRIAQKDHIRQREDRLAVECRGHPDRRAQAFFRCFRQSFAVLQDRQVQVKQADDLIRKGRPVRIVLQAFEKSYRPLSRPDPLIIPGRKDVVRQIPGHGGDHIADVAQKGLFRKHNPLFGLFFELRIHQADPGVVAAGDVVLFELLNGLAVLFQRRIARGNFVPDADLVDFRIRVLGKQIDGVPEQLQRSPEFGVLSVHRADLLESQCGSAYNPEMVGKLLQRVLVFSSDFQDRQPFIRFPGRDSLGQFLNPVGFRIRIGAAHGKADQRIHRYVKEFGEVHDV